MKKTKTIIIILLISFSFLAIQPVAAQGTGVFQGISDCQKSGDCSLCDFLSMFVNLGRWVLSVTGGVALIFFIWAGIGFILSFGNAEKVTEAKGQVVGAVIGIIIIIAAWALINLMFLHFVGNDGNNMTGESGVINVWGDKPWSTVGGMCD